MSLHKLGYVSSDDANRWAARNLLVGHASVAAFDNLNGEHFDDLILDFDHPPLGEEPEKVIAAAVKLADKVAVHGYSLTNEQQAELAQAGVGVYRRLEEAVAATCAGVPAAGGRNPNIESIAAADVPATPATPLPGSGATFPPRSDPSRDVAIVGGGGEVARKRIQPAIHSARLPNVDCVELSDPPPA